MITKEQALTMHWSTEIHYTGRHQCTRTVGKRGGITERITRVRINGSAQTWKTRPNEWRLPVKYGMREYTSITHHDAGDWHVAADCPLAKVETGA
jgi:hypothetical protein